MLIYLDNISIHIYISTYIRILLFTFASHDRIWSLYFQWLLTIQTQELLILLRILCSDIFTNEDFNCYPLSSIEFEHCNLPFPLYQPWSCGGAYLGLASVIELGLQAALDFPTLDSVFNRQQTLQMISKLLVLIMSWMKHFTGNTALSLMLRW